MTASGTTGGDGLGCAGGAVIGGAEGETGVSPLPQLAAMSAAIATAIALAASDERLRTRNERDRKNRRRVTESGKTSPRPTHLPMRQR
jgi:hypothetical protein